MAYSTKFKLKVLKHAYMGISPVEHIAIIRNVPKQTIYRWRYLFARYGEEGLRNRKPGAKKDYLNPKFEAKVLTLWASRIRGVHKMWLGLRSEGFDVSERQIQKIYRKHKLKMNPRKRPSQIKFVKYEWPKPNMLWHIDWTICPFTGMQLIAFIDDHSRFIVHAEYFTNATVENTVLAFSAAIRRYGIPENVLTDNGVQFHVHGDFENFCEQNGIKHILGRVHHPQTNGKIERWFGTYKLEFKDGEDTLTTYVKYYNEERLHQGIGYKVPLERYESNINAV